jgi:hypothetical protein
MTPIVRTSLLLLALFAVSPLLAGERGAEVTLPVTGYLELPNDLVYRTELTITNHRDVQQYVVLERIGDGHIMPFRAFPIPPRETRFLAEPFGGGNGMSNFIAALRIRTITGIDENSDEYPADSAGDIEAHAFIVADRGRFAKDGSSRQEVEGIASDEYHAEEAVFLGVRHSAAPPAYTNVGVVNMHATETVTFYVQFQYQDPFPVTVPPLSQRQVRITGPASGGRYVRVTPEWALTDEAPPRTTPWVAYASTIDSQTGDAFSGMRVPATSKYEP